MSSDSDELSELEALHQRGLLSEEELLRARARHDGSVPGAEDTVPLPAGRSALLSAGESPESDDGCATEAIPRFPESGDTIHEGEDPPPVDKQTVREAGKRSSARSQGAGIGKFFVALALVVLGLGLSTGAWMFFGDDVEALVRSTLSSDSSKDRSDRKEEPLVSPADICELRWDIEHPGRAYEASEENWRDVDEMRKCHDDHKERKERVEEEVWWQYSDCIADAKSTYDIGECEMVMNGRGRSGTHGKGSKR